MKEKRSYIQQVHSNLKTCLFLFASGVCLTYAYLSRVQQALKSAGSRASYVVGFLHTLIWDAEGKHTLINWGFLLLVLLGIMLLYMTILAKEEAEDDA